MSVISLIPYWGAAAAGVVAVAVLFRKRRSVAGWCFFAGMVGLAVESVCAGLSLEATEPEEISYWQGLVLVAKTFEPAAWLCFSLTYSRGNHREFVRRWRWALVAAALIPLGWAFWFRTDLVEVVPHAPPRVGWWLSFGWPAKGLGLILLISAVLVLTNIERTFRAAVGTLQWRLKFVALGLAVLFGSLIYSGSQTLLFSGRDLALSGVEAGALIVSCALIAVGYLRHGFGVIDVYPSRTVLHSSVTLLLVGGYLFAVGVLAKAVTIWGDATHFQIQAFLILIGIAILGVLLLSDRLRLRLHQFISRHFKRPQHDFRQVWTLFTARLLGVVDPRGLCRAASELISETFNVLSVTVWLLDERSQRLVLAASTTLPTPTDGAVADDAAPDAAAVEAGLREHPGPFDLDQVAAGWADGLRRISAPHFRKGGNRICVPLRAGGRCLAVTVLADRVNGIPYTFEELDLLKCLGDQAASGLLNLRLTDELMLGKELAAFQSMSAFFVHDLKNAASTLSLMLQNLKVHFDNPDFRQDALRAIGKTVDHITGIIARLSAFRQKPELKRQTTDFNELVAEAVRRTDCVPGVEWTSELDPVPNLIADSEQLQTVLTNLLLNAREALGGTGRVSVATGHCDGRITLSVSDTGCGMTPTFVANSLFRPFQTTKKKGLGIGMFQCRMIVEAHGGTIQAESQPGRGTTVRVILPLR